MHPQVRDVAWAFFSPNLVAHSSGLNIMNGELLGISREKLIEFAAYLQKIDLNPTPLERYLKEFPNKRLGDYFEALIAFGLNAIPCCHKIEHKLVIKDKYETLGEFDFLFFSDEMNTTIHWEVAVKFYLYHGTKDDFSCYIGANPEDTLELKVSSLKKQVAFSSTKPAKTWLKQNAFFPLQSACILKGYLFYPLSNDGIFQPLMHSDISPTRLYGWYDKMQNNGFKLRLEQLEGEKNCRFLLLPKFSWLSPPQFAEDDSRIQELTLPSKKIISMLENKTSANNGSALVSCIRLQDGLWQEIERGIIVSNHWPSLTKNN